MYGLPKNDHFGGWLGTPATHIMHKKSHLGVVILPANHIMGYQGLECKLITNQPLTSITNEQEVLRLITSHYYKATNYGH